ncbi:Mfs1.1 [Epithele typhae]|uniref:Mfs1.1 n=1 Tax=Epithele typhae TaxID=378194 RepID=UPI002008AC96|nr:Mfs1.1 [Epithele typhae]KAH9933578.1 Mfs1.1 [Epithele typhae]
MSPPCPSTALPTITKDLNGGDEFVWVGHAAYNLAAAAILPFTARLADIIGWRLIMLACVGFFFLRSLLCATAQNMHWLIAARTVQGIAGEGIITSDLVPLAGHGLYQGLLVLTWAFVAGIGPVTGGSFAQKATWWLFYLNLPLAGIAFLLAMIFLRVRTPEGSLRKKISRIDFVGNPTFIACTTLASVALAWGGICYPWSSAHVLAPLILGFLLIFVYEIIALICPQGRLAYPVFPTASVLSSSAIVFGVLARVMKKYRPANVIGRVLLIGFGLLTPLKADSCTSEVGFQVITAIADATRSGRRPSTPSSLPWGPSRAPSPRSPSTPLRAHSRRPISASVFQRELKATLAAYFPRTFPAGVEIASAAVPLIHALPQRLGDEGQGVKWTKGSFGGAARAYAYRPGPGRVRSGNEYEYGRGRGKEDDDLELGLGMGAGARMRGTDAQVMVLVLNRPSLP